MFDPKGTSLFGKLAMEGGIAGNNHGGSPILSEKEPKDGDRLPRAGRQDYNDGVLLARECLMEQKSLVVAGEGGSRAFHVKR